MRIAGKIASTSDPYLQTRILVVEALAELRYAHEEGLVTLSQREVPWLDMMEMPLEEIPETEDELIEAMIPDVDPSVCLLSEYGIETRPVGVG